MWPSVVASSLGPPPHTDPLVGAPQLDLGDAGLVHSLGPAHRRWLSHPQSRDESSAVAADVAACYSSFGLNADAMGDDRYRWAVVDGLRCGAGAGPGRRNRPGCSVLLLAHILRRVLVRSMGWAHRLPARRRAPVGAPVQRGGPRRRQ